MKYSEKTQRLDRRRRAQERPEFKERYRKRAGVEGVMSALKRGYGFGRLRVRGMRAVSMELYLKAAGYNLKQAAKWRFGQGRRGIPEAVAGKMRRIWHRWSCSRHIRAIKNALGHENRESIPSPRGWNAVLRVGWFEAKTVLAG